MFWFSIFISIIVVLLGTLALEINKPVVLMVATLFFTIVIFSEQSKKVESQIDTQIGSLKNQVENLELSKQEMAIQYTPDLRAYLGYADIKAGTYDDSKPGRRDDHIVTPIQLCNRTYGYAKDIVLTMCYNYGGDDGILQREIPFMKGGDITPNIGFAPSVTQGYRGLFLEGKKSYKVKIILEWKDVSGKGYKSVETFVLDTEKQGSDVPLMFVFKPKKYFSTIDNDIKIVNSHAKTAVDF